MSHPQHNLSQRSAIEQIVRQVLAELRSGHSPPSRANAPSVASSNGSATQLTLTTKVVSASLLEGRLEGISQLVVPRGAVVTPAARDQLKQHQVTIASAVSPAKNSAATELRVAVASTRYDAKPLLAALAGEGVNLEHAAASNLIEAIQTLASTASDGFALLITDETAAALCLANRQLGVRAALAGNSTEVAAAVAAVGPNFLIVAPSGRSVFEMKQAIGAWLRHGRPICPAALSKHLE